MDAWWYFARIIDDRYDHSEQRRIVHSYHTRLYFDRDRLIAWTDSAGRERAPTGPAAEEQELDAMRSFRELRRCALSTSSESCEASRDSSTK